MPESTIDVQPQGPGHFEITVTDAGFEGLSRVKQQQRVYGAITELMSGPNPPVHAVDRLECLVP
jgi:acid stress-induced BolA-like protein IbaG/YrbA